MEPIIASHGIILTDEDIEKGTRELLGDILTETIMDSINVFEKLEDVVSYPSYIKDIGRNRRLSVSLQPGNVYVWLCAYDPKDTKFNTDLVCIFNGDYDGPLYVNWFKTTYYQLTGEELTIKEK